MKFNFIPVTNKSLKKLLKNLSRLFRSDFSVFEGEFFESHNHHRFGVNDSSKRHQFSIVSGESSLHTANVNSSHLQLALRSIVR